MQLQPNNQMEFMMLYKEIIKNPNTESFWESRHETVQLVSESRSAPLFTMDQSEKFNSLRVTS